MWLNEISTELSVEIVPIDADISKYEQTSGLVEVPPFHSYQVSYSQTELHPSPFTLLLSSHPIPL